MSDLLTSPDLKTERATEPPKRWRNWWIANYPSVRTLCDLCGGSVPFIKAGDKYATHCFPHPSKDVAESEASRQIEDDIAEWGEQLDEYLGAFPDGKAP